VRSPSLAFVRRAFRPAAGGRFVVGLDSMMFRGRDDELGTSSEMTYLGRRRRSRLIWGWRIPDAAHQGSFGFIGCSGCAMGTTFSERRPEKKKKVVAADTDRRDHLLRSPKYPQATSGKRNISVYEEKEMAERTTSRGAL